MPDRDIVDDIDRLVDEQLTNPSSFTRSRPTRCPHCGRDFHGLAITQRMEEMRQEHMQRLYEHQVRILQGDEVGDLHYAESEFDPDYRYDEDDSEVLCPGSMAEHALASTSDSNLAWPNSAWPGPVALAEWQRHLLEQMLLGFDYSVIDRWIGTHAGQGAVTYNQEPDANPPRHSLPDGPPYLAVPHPQTGQRVGVEIDGQIYVGRATVDDHGNGAYSVSIDDIEPPIQPGPSMPRRGLFQQPSSPWIGTTSQPPTPPPSESRFDDRGRPRPPRPAHTPPMWANNPTRERRRRRNN
ncbi:hypothetical protein [Williamsia sp.]|uniref:hypothetical protein n=1 Tax=Williamsia sp. TaxID=1872085 RepID=UPI002F94389C